LSNSEGTDRRYPTGVETVYAIGATKTSETKSVSEPLRLKVSDKGGVSVYGLGRFPLTLYRGQWERLFPEIENIKKFIADNVDKLAVK